MTVCCHCAYSKTIPASTRSAVLAGMPASDDIAGVTDLCGLAARRDPLLAKWARTPRLTIVACHERAVRALFDWSGSPLRSSAVVLDMRRLAPDDILSRIPRKTGARARSRVASVKARGSWVPWFPVLDRARCVNCKQCVSFCAFGVYSIENGRVQVANPANCKNNCPACARMCPHLAIIFPKCAEEPIGGAEVTAEHLRSRRAMAARQPSRAGIRSIIAARSGRAGSSRG